MIQILPMVTGEYAKEIKFENLADDKLFVQDEHFDNFDEKMLKESNLIRPQTLFDKHSQSSQIYEEEFFRAMSGSSGEQRLRQQQFLEYCSLAACTQWAVKGISKY